ITKMRKHKSVIAIPKKIVLPGLPADEVRGRTRNPALTFQKNRNWIPGSALPRDPGMTEK
ncbi:MAG: hypothetical protein ACREP1_07880, partial [Rhodanobacteraceae bacterium]